MFEEFVESLEDVRLTIVSGIFLLISFAMEGKIVDLPEPAWISVLISGIPIFYYAVKCLISAQGVNRISSALLISIAMTASIIIGDVFAAGEIAFIMALGEMLEDKTTKKARAGIKQLVSLTPQTGRRIINDVEEIIATEDIKIDDIIRVLPGESIPVDGEIIGGETSIDQSIMTGESLPVDKKIGDTVFSGTINRFGAIDVKATKVGADSSMQKLIRLVQDSEGKQAPMQRIADRYASYLVPLALMIAVVTYFVTEDVTRAVTILVVFCPCALVLATPTAIMAAIGQATNHGVLIKSGEALETMGNVNVIAFDKTGTLTYGKLKVSDIISFNADMQPNELLRIAASAESKSEHPLGKSIVETALEKNIALRENINFKMTAGKGVSSEIEQHIVHCGNERYLADNGIEIHEAAKNKLNDLHSQGKASIIVAVDDNCVGLIALSDTLRPNAKAMINNLLSLNVQPILLTGDNLQTADHFAKQVDISEVHAGLLPQDKVEKLNSIQKNNACVCMIGDGVNDAPALKAANVSVAMAAIGSDIAIEAADIALMTDDISKISYLKKLSNATRKTILFGISLSMLINFVAIILSVKGILTPTTGALVHNFGSCLVILIAAMLYDKKFDDNIDSSTQNIENHLLTNNS